MAQAASSVLDYIVPASDLNHGKAAQIINRVQVGSPVIIVKRSVPTAVVITPEEYREYERLREAREDAADLALAEERLARWNGDTSKLKTHEELMEELGISQEEVDAMPEVEFE
ncbi:type II toxin-antitoxin system prevent-host-death family antitoxin [Collinsella sp. An2]|uniref:type II toxin-antitoxin system prevent-host-death family antitoxin n=1 Tax=Collinsella sp. An2 TaxID=1965585 RepID=UPI001302E24B|nr:type II toxin-antitoxin system prevent-host-death family antitoxin [Collinsella sp. An2]